MLRDPCSNERQTSLHITLIKMRYYKTWQPFLLHDYFINTQNFPNSFCKKAILIWIHNKNRSRWSSNKLSRFFSTFIAYKRLVTFLVWKKVYEFYYNLKEHKPDWILFLPDKFHHHVCYARFMVIIILELNGIHQLQSIWVCRRCLSSILRCTDYIEKNAFGDWRID